MRADALMPRDLFRGEPARDEPEDLDLPIGQREAGARAFQQDATRHRPTEKRAEHEPADSADTHGGMSGAGLRRR